MSALTGIQIMNNVKGNLGDRASGEIGGLPIDTAVLRSMNRGLLYLGKRYNLPDLQRDITINVDTDDYSYDLPTQQSAETFKIKPASIQVAMALRSGEDREYPLTGLNRRSKMRSFGVTSSSIQTGRITIYTIRGRKIEFHPFPDENHTVTLDCYIYAPFFTASNLANSHSLGEEWDDVLEAFVTYDLWMKLQQTNDADIWYRRFKMEESTTKSSLNDDVDTWVPNRGDLEHVHPYDLLNDPMIVSYNSD